MPVNPLVRAPQAHPGDPVAPTGEPDADDRFAGHRDPPCVGITGASGYLGTRLGEHFDRAGWRVIRLVRTPGAGVASDRYYDLTEPVDPAVFDSIDVLVHAAYDLTARRAEEVWRNNVDGSRRLIDAARRSGVERIIVLSSMSAYEGTTQLYGRAKLAIEAATLAAGGYVVRPGLVWGERPGGMAGALERLCRLPLVPLVAGGSRQFLVCDVDVAAAVAALATTTDLAPQVIGVADPRAERFRTVLETFARRQGVRCRFLPVPWRPVHWMLRAAEAVRVPLPIRADSLVGLVHPAPGVPGLEALARLGIRPRPFAVASP
jgi:nucleoside-diphosphate-sugar epimerase